MALTGLDVTQYMYVLFDKVHIYIKNLSLHWRVMFSNVLPLRNICCGQYCHLATYLGAYLVDQGGCDGTQRLWAYSGSRWWDLAETRQRRVVSRS
jgi:hypothetical protein